MAGIEQQPTTSGDQDNSLEAMKLRLLELQPLLGDVILKSDKIFDDIFPFAPKPVDAPKDFPVTAVSSINTEPSRELTIRLGDNRVVCIHKHPPSLTPTYPLQRVWFSRPDEESNLRRRVEILKVSGRRNHEYLPYDIETSRFESSWHHDFIGFGYVDQKPSINETLTALDEADIIAKKALGIINSGRIKAQ